MPITVEAIHSLQNVTIRNQIERLYELSPEFGDGQDAIEKLDHVLNIDTTLYTANFNDKIIGAVWCSRSNYETEIVASHDDVVPVEDDRVRVLQYVIIHPANRDRGVAEHLIDEVCNIEEQQGIDTFIAGCGAIQRCLIHLGRLKVGYE